MSDAVPTVKTFFEGAREGRLTGIKCGGCGEVAIPPKMFCASCQQRAWETIALSGKGTLVSYTIIRVAATAHVDETPYAVGVVKLEEGASIFGRLVDVPFDALTIGLPVRFRPLTVKDKSVVGFSL